MKRTVFKIITTILYIGVITTSFLVSVSAAPVTQPLVSAYGWVFNGDQSVTTPAMTVRPYNSDLESMFDFYGNDIIVACPSNMYGQYDNYITFTEHMNFGVSAIDDPKATIRLDFGKMNYQEFNSMKFNVGIFFNPQDSYDPMYNMTVSVNGDIDFLDKTVISTQTYFKTYQYSVNGVYYEYSYATYDLEVLLDKVYEAGDYEIIIEVNTFLPPFNREIIYAIGCDNLVCSLLSDEEQDEVIKDAVVNISNIQNQINNKTTIISNHVSDIKDILSTTLTPEQMQKIEEGREYLEGASLEIKESAEADAELQEYINATFERYKDFDYDLFGDHYDEHVENYVEPVFNNDGFRSFWNGLWSHNFIQAMVITVVTFATIGFALYGIR